MYLHVYEPTLIKGENKKFIQYKLFVKNRTETIFKTYSDFYEFQKLLTYNWPGIYIPCLPEKLLIDNPNDSLIQKRQKILNNFCLKIAKIDYITNSNEFKSFLKDNNILTNDIYPKIIYSELLLKYKNNFKNINKNIEEKIDLDKVEEAIIYNKNNINNLLDFQKDVSEVMKEKEIEIKNITELFEIFTEYENNILIQYTKCELTKLIFSNPEHKDISNRINSLNNDLINPYKELLEWTENDILDFKSMLNALEKFKNFILLYNNNKIRIREINKKIIEIKSNKNNNNYLNIFLNCSSTSEDKLENLIKERETIENDNKYLLDIINIINSINDEFIIKFKKEKMEKYNEQFKIFIEEDKKNRNIINDLWDCISNVIKSKNLGKENKEQNISP